MNCRKILFFLFLLLCVSGTLYAQGQTTQPPTTPPIAQFQLPSCSAAAKFYSKDSIVITTFGASTVHGMYGSTFQAPLQQDFEHCYLGKVVNITNNGIPSETTLQGMSRFSAAIAGRTGFLLILMGANDAVAMANKKQKIADTEKCMRYYIKTALDKNLIPIIGTIQFFNDKNNAFNKTVNLYVKQINALYKKIAKDNNLYVADINKALGRDFSLYKDDIHPNDQGNDVIAYVWFDTVNQAIEDKLLLIGLNQNYPNPVKAATKIGFSLSQAGRVQIKLYNMNGAEVKDIYDEYQSSGYHELSASMSDINPGIYIYSMQVGGQRLSKKMIVVR